MPDEWNVQKAVKVTKRALETRGEPAWAPVSCECGDSFGADSRDRNPLAALLLRLLLWDAAPALKTARLSEEKSASSYQPVEVPPHLKTTAWLSLSVCSEPVAVAPGCWQLLHLNETLNLLFKCQVVKAIHQNNTMCPSTIITPWGVSPWRHFRKALHSGRFIFCLHLGNLSICYVMLSNVCFI